MILCILQARISSSRLPGKVLKEILGRPMVWHQWERIKLSKCIDAQVLATSNDVSDDKLAQYFLDRNELVFRGSLNDVLGRYYQCALQYKPTHVVRLTADCPLIDPGLIDQVIERHLQKKNDYTSLSGFPIGLSVEVMSFEVLEIAHQEARMRSQREHVTLFLYQHNERFKCDALHSGEDLSHFRWTVDYLEDFKLVEAVYNALHLSKPNFDMYDVLDFMKKNPLLVALNSHFQHNEGLLKSLSNDELFKK